MINNKIDFILTISVNDANPNGDPLGGNMPRTDYYGNGEISDVCIKRKIRNRLQDLGYDTFVQMAERSQDGETSLENRFETEFPKKDKVSDSDVYDRSCQKWLDVRSFGQVMTFQKRSIGIRGPISIGIAKSLEGIDITSIQITKSVNGVNPKGDKEKSSDTMGMKHYVNHGVYVIYGSINAYFADKTGFSQEDAEIIKEALLTLFINDSSSARPDGSMVVEELYWFTHSSKLGDVSSAKIKRLLRHDKPSVNGKPEYSDYHIHLDEEKLAEYTERGLTVEVFEGL